MATGLALKYELKISKGALTHLGCGMFYFGIDDLEGAGGGGGLIHLL